MLAGFEIANVDKRVLGLNIVEAQDDYTPMHDFELQISMFAYLHGVYPKVHIDTALLATSPKATLEWQEEVAFEEFERGF